jgi:hypothetical protein
MHQDNNRLSVSMNVLGGKTEIWAEEREICLKVIEEIVKRIYFILTASVV